MAIRDSGFGLNYNQGFGSGKSFMPNLGAIASDNASNRQFASDFQNRRQQKELAGEQNQLQRDLQANQLAQADRNAALQAALQRQGYDSQQTIARLQADASTLAERNKQGFRQQLFPSFLNLLNSGAGGTTREGYQGGGQVGTAPTITAGGIYSPQQIQERVNATRAQNDARTASQNAAQERTMAGRGFGSRSPLAMQLANSNQMANMAANAQAENDIRWGAAEGNARQLLESQRAQESQFASRQQEEIERNKQKSGLLTGLLGAFGSFF